MENNNKTTGIIIGLLVLVLIVGGVVWAMNMNNNEEDTMDNTSQTEQMNDTAQQSAGDIVAVASGAPNLSTLVAAVQAADLVETLQGEGPFTVFAPTNAAFEALPEGTLDSLLMPENKDQLAAILTYHVVAGKVMAADLSDGQVVETVQGENLTVEIKDGMVYLIDADMNKVVVETADVKADNGVVHIIGGVLMPKS